MREFGQTNELCLYAVGPSGPNFCGCFRGRFRRFSVSLTVFGGFRPAIEKKSPRFFPLPEGRFVEIPPHKYNGHEVEAFSNLKLKSQSRTKMAICVEGPGPWKRSPER
jgi:hypothetical protein